MVFITFAVLLLLNLIGIDVLAVVVLSGFCLAGICFHIV